jgi:hypothetical protein
LGATAGNKTYLAGGSNPTFKTAGIPIQSQHVTTHKQGQIKKHTKKKRGCQN